MLKVLLKELVLVSVIFFASVGASYATLPPPPSQEEMDQLRQMGDENLKKYGDGGVEFINGEYVIRPTKAPTPKKVMPKATPTVVPTVTLTVSPTEQPQPTQPVATPMPERAKENPSVSGKIKQFFLDFFARFTRK